MDTSTPAPAHSLDDPLTSMDPNDSAGLLGVTPAFVDRDPVPSRRAEQRDLVMYTSELELNAPVGAGRLSADGLAELLDIAAQRQAGTDLMDASIPASAYSLDGPLSSVDLLDSAGFLRVASAFVDRAPLRAPASPRRAE
jgi:hypothetical protein